MMKGVNLGGWLVLEKWIAPALFAGVEAEDETYLCKELGRERATERLTAFRDTFIGRRDFAEIADKGFQAVRIPIPFFLFDDVGPYIHCYEYVDKAFEWAEEWAEHPAGSAHRPRRAQRHGQFRHTRHFPVGRTAGSAGIQPGNPGADRRPLRTAESALGHQRIE